MSDPNAPENQPSFEAALAELEQIVADLEDGKLGLEPSLARFEQGIHLLRNCHRILEQAEHKIELLVRLEADGSEVSTPFDATATYETDAPQKKTRRRKPVKPTAQTVGPEQSAATPAEPPTGSDEAPPSLF